MSKQFKCPECERVLETKTGLQSHRSQVHDPEWKDRDTLYEMYVEQEMSMDAVAEELGCEPATVSRNLKQAGIESRSHGYHARKPKMPLQMGPYGRMRWRSSRSSGGEKESYGFEVHRLLAVAEYGTDRVANNDVHHKNGIPWDNRPGNIEVLSKEEHARLHARDQRSTEEAQ